MTSRRSTNLVVREDGAGDALVLLHGLASSGRYWGRPLPLSERHHVLAPDLLGFGRSPKPRSGGYTPAEHLATLHPALCSRLSLPFHLLGHSLGSLLALHYAAAYPEHVRTLTLISLPVVGRCAWGHGRDGGMGRWHRFSVHSRAGGLVFEAGMRAAAPLWARWGPRFRPDVPPDVTRDALAGTWNSYWRSLEEVVYGTDVPELIDRLRVPVTVIHGTRDTVAPVDPVRELAAAAPALTLLELKGAGHNPYFTHREATLHVIEEALRR